MLWKGSQVPCRLGNIRKRTKKRPWQKKGNQGVGDVRFINILQLVSIYFFFSIILLCHFFSIRFYPRHLPTPTHTTRDPHPRPTTSTHYPRPTTFSYTLFCSVNHLSGPLRKQCLLARVQKVMVCDSWLVDFDPFCLFRVSRFVALWSSCLGQ